MSVDFVRPEVKAKQAAWKMVRDCVAGSEAVKAGGYVIPVNPHDSSTANRLRNEQRVKRAYYFNATGRTLPALVGIAFGKWPEVQLPGALDPLKQDVDGSGVGLINQSQGVVSEVLQTARAGLLADYPAGSVGRTVAEAEGQGLRPTISLYRAESIINWRTERRGARNLLTLVVLAESYEDWGDDFELETKGQYRVLRLTSEGYKQEVWREARDKGEWEIAEEHMPLDGNGQPWDEIPFAFVGATNNDPEPDQPPLYDLADTNIAHFRNSADHEESLFFAGQAQVWLTGSDINEEQIALMEKEGIYVGSRAIGIAPGGVTMLQAQPVSALAEEMRHKVDLMARLGARMVAPGEAVRSATEAASDDKTNNSILSIVCDNVSDAYRKVLGWCARFARASGEVDFTIGTEFSGIMFDAQQVTAAMALVQAGKLPETDLWTYLRSVGLIEATKSDDDIRDELETQGGGGLTLDDLPALMGAANGAAGAR